MKVLWSKPNTFFSGADAAGVVLGTGMWPGDATLIVDQRTGRENWQGPAMVGGGYGFVITLQGGAGNPDTICARKTKSPDTCFWTAARNIDEESTDLYYWVFGGGAWLQTRSSVLDMATGRPAPFGADVNDGLNGAAYVSYQGPSKDRVIRENTTPRQDFVSWQIQRWNVSSNTGIGQLFTSSASNGMGWTFDGESPNYLLQDDTGVTAFSWQTGQQQWQVAMPSGSGCAGIHGKAVVIGNYCGLNGELGGGMFVPGVAAFDLATGDKIWNDPSLAQLVNNGAGNIGRALYLMDQKSLYAYDNSTFTALGSVALPANTSWVDVANSHVFAVSGSQLYVLLT